MAHVPIGTLYKHLKTGGTYIVVGHCQLEATNRPGILYVSTKGGKIWARDIDEFLDIKRFEPLPPRITGSAVVGQHPKRRLTVERR